MSAFGTKRTSQWAEPMSAFGGKADIERTGEQPSKFQVIVNNKTAQALGLSISPTLAAQVDEIID